MVLGAGYIGKAIAIDLSKKYYITAADIDEKSLDFFKDKTNIRTKVIDVTNGPDLSAAIKDYDLIVSAVPGFLGFHTMKNIIESKKNLIDISFMPEDVLQLDSLAKDNNVTVIMDCGVAPGLPNYILGYYNEKMSISNAEYYVGGLPKIREYPFEYKAPFSPIDVIEEYSRPARFIQNGKAVNRPAMSDLELMHFAKVGTLEAFNTDGLRSLISTLKNIPNIKEKTLRYPGHINLIKALMESGFFDKKPINVNGAYVTPFDFTTRILFDNWKLNDSEEDFTVMKVKFKGIEEGIEKEIIYNLFDQYDKKSGFSSMARTTGYTATATAEMFLNNMFEKKGVFPPELVGKHPSCFNYILNYLKARNIYLEMKELILN